MKHNLIKLIIILIIKIVEMIQKSKNTFLQPILHENLFYTEIERTSKIGNVEIKEGWIKDMPPKQYYSHLFSAMALSELELTLHTLKQNEQTNQINTFKMAEIKQQIQHINEPYSYEDYNIDNFKPPSKMTVQKVSGFFNSSYMREATLHQTTLTISSTKPQVSTAINLSSYTLELEDKVKPLSRVQFVYFTWPQGFESRLLIYSDNLRSYCLYADKKNLTKIISYIKTRSLQNSNMAFFQGLSQQYFQKIITLFGTRIRLYDHQLKERRNNIELMRKEKHHHTDRNNYQLKTHQKQNHATFQSPTIKPLEDNSIMLSPNSKNRNPNSSIVKLRGRRSTIYYDELQDSIAISRIPDFKINDIKLDLKEDAYSQSQIAQSRQEHQKAESQIEQSKSNNQSQDIDEMQNIYKTKVSHPKIVVSMPNQETAGSYAFVKKKLDIFCFVKKVKTLVPCQRKQFKLNIRQKIQPQIQYANQKISICCAHQIPLVKQSQDYYVPQSNAYFNISSQSNQFIFSIETQIEEISLEFICNTNNINYQINKSQLFCCQKFVGIVTLFMSCDPIYQLQEYTTIQFMKKYLLEKNQDYLFKCDFIDSKRKQQQLKTIWNKKIMIKIIKSSDQTIFQKGLYMGIPQSILKKIFNSLAKQKKELLSTFEFNNKDYQKIQYAIFKEQIQDIRTFIKPSRIIMLILSTNPNPYLKERLSDVKAFFSYKYRSLKQLGEVYCIEIIRKIMPILTLCKSEEEIKSIIQLYFQVEYQIDELFLQISKYFKKSTSKHSKFQF